MCFAIEANYFLLILLLLITITLSFTVTSYWRLQRLRLHHILLQSFFCQVTWSHSHLLCKSSFPNSDNTVVLGCSHPNNIFLEVLSPRLGTWACEIYLVLITSRCFTLQATFLFLQNQIITALFWTISSHGCNSCLSSFFTLLFHTWIFPT